jgi:hypothetical protein
MFFLPTLHGIQDVIIPPNWLYGKSGLFDLDFTLALSPTVDIISLDNTPNLGSSLKQEVTPSALGGYVFPILLSASEAPRWPF